MEFNSGFKGLKSGHLLAKASEVRRISQPLQTNVVGNSDKGQSLKIYVPSESQFSVILAISQMCHVKSRGLRKFRTAYIDDVNCCYCSVSHSVPPLSYISGVTTMTRKPSDNDLLPHVWSKRNKVLRRGVCKLLMAVKGSGIDNIPS